ncbi:16S rRNA (cytosine967-C5)-methyltransferase [Bryocella elongata]|uniref:16S rRNA (Cytosine967-C5)-methyltransferase n=1 Tax=Bryocella elongata TaxID=863522 RepID=A0A1H5ZDN0_9BACT|nr:16S rRNA (cytosine967-C5)-methyltransferase [Bryocella elongata]
MPAKPISPARKAAFAILERVLESEAHSDDLLHGPGMSALSQQDRNLATALVLGTLRWKLALDAELIPLLSRPDVRLSNAIATTLELGAFQLRHMDRIPVHAALDESVELVRAAGQSHATGMVNAILRKLSTQKAPAPKVFETPAQLAERLGHPGWIVERWVKNYGLAAARAICEYDQREPGARPSSALEAAEVAPPESEVTAPEVAEPEAPQHGVAAILEVEAPATPEQLIEAAPELAPRAATIDPGSRLVAELTAALAPASATRIRVWDACAAPGGKTRVLAELLPDAEIFATDVSPRRMKAMQERLERDGLAERIRTEVAEAETLSEESGPFDLILCDAPCSGTGTLARNPEIRLRLEPAHLSRQAKRQREILRGVLGRLRPGGRLVYSTCSLEPEENEAVVEAVLQKVANIGRVDLTAVIMGKVAAENASAIVRNGCLRTLPGANFAGDGFFAAAFERLPDDAPKGVEPPAVVAAED